MFAEFALLVEGSLFLIGCLNLLPIYVSFRKRIAPQRWEFQCRILNCIIFRNEKLNLIGVVESPNCAFCQEEAESVEHLLFSCRISSNFLKHVLSWLRHYGPHVGTINESDVIFGKFDIVEDYILINHILRIGKYYIYYRKCQNSVPSIRGFITRARRVFNIELHIAREKNILLFHFQKWEKLTNALNSSYNSFKIFPRF